MRTLLTISFAIMAMLAVAGNRLSRVEKLTAVERAKLIQAQERLSDAMKNLEKVKAEIAESHKMQTVDYMEWASLVVFDGDYILLYYNNRMGEW